MVLNNVLGAKFKLVKGYAGSAALRLALERGEIEGFCGVGYNSMRDRRPDRRPRQRSWCRSGCRRIRSMPDVPFIMDYAKIDEDRQIFRLVFGWLDLERPIAAPPGTPQERVNALRDGFRHAP